MEVKGARVPIKDIVIQGMQECMVERDARSSVTYSMMNKERDGDAKRSVWSAGNDEAPKGKFTEPFERFLVKVLEYSANIRRVRKFNDMRKVEFLEANKGRITRVFINNRYSEHRVFIDDVFQGPINEGFEIDWNGIQLVTRCRPDAIIKADSVTDDIVFLKTTFHT
jgi:hypothetical protein